MAEEKEIPDDQVMDPEAFIKQIAELKTHGELVEMFPDDHEEGTYHPYWDGAGDQLHRIILFARAIRRLHLSDD